MFTVDITCLRYGYFIHSFLDVCVLPLFTYLLLSWRSLDQYKYTDGSISYDQVSLSEVICIPCVMFCAHGEWRI